MAVSVGTVIGVTCTVIGTIVVLNVAAVGIAIAAEKIVAKVEKDKAKKLAEAAFAKHQASLKENVTATVDAEGRIHSVG